MAAALLQDRLKAWGVADQFTVSSAGIAAWTGQAASTSAVEVMAQQGLSLKEHSARQIDNRQIYASDLVLALTVSHKESLLCIAPGARNRIVTLGEYAGKPGDVTDPMGRSREVYQACANQLTELIEAARDKILKLAGKNG
jgi:protein-tyrosine-phosphatase